MLGAGIFYGWWVLLACSSIILFGASWVNYGFTALFDPIQRELGWSTSILAFAFSMRNLGGPIAGVLIDRFGPRRIITVGVVSTAIGAAILSNVQSLFVLYGSFVFLAVGNGLSNPMPGTVAIARWFTYRRARAFSIFTVLNGFGGLTIPFLGLAINSLGWRMALRVFAVMTTLICIPLTFVVKDRPEPPTALPGSDAPSTTDAPERPDPATRNRDRDTTAVAEDFTARQALGSRSFWHLAGAITFAGLGTTPVMTLLVPSLLRQNVATPTALILASSLPLLSLPWRLIVGWLGDYFDKRLLLGVCYLFSAVSLLCLANGSSLLWLILFAIAYSIGFGGPNPLRPALQADYFGTKAMGTIQGLTQLFTFFDNVVGPLFVGWIVDRTGSYRSAWLILGILAAAAAPLILTMPAISGAQNPKQRDLGRTDA